MVSQFVRIPVSCVPSDIKDKVPEAETWWKDATGHRGQQCRIDIESKVLINVSRSSREPRFYIQDRWDCVPAALLFRASGVPD